MMKILATAVCSAAVVFGAAQAQDDPKDKKPDPDLLFKKLDVSPKDNRLSKDEFLKLAEFGRDKTKARDFLARAYDKVYDKVGADKDKKGLTPEQFKTLFLDIRKKNKDGDGSKG
jgi:hypothetical protein